MNEYYNEFKVFHNPNFRFGYPIIIVVIGNENNNQSSYIEYFLLISNNLGLEKEYECFRINYTNVIIDDKYEILKFDKESSFRKGLSEGINALKRLNNKKIEQNRLDFNNNDFNFTEINFTTWDWMNIKTELKNIFKFLLSTKSKNFKDFIKKIEELPEIKFDFEEIRPTSDNSQ